MDAAWNLKFQEQTPGFPAEFQQTNFLGLETNQHDMSNNYRVF